MSNRSELYHSRKVGCSSYKWLHNRRFQNDWGRIYWSSVHQPNKPSHISTSRTHPALDWFILHSLVFCLWSYVYQVHKSSGERNHNLACCISIHGPWYTFYDFVGWNLCLINIRHTLKLTIKCMSWAQPWTKTIDYHILYLLELIYKHQAKWSNY